MTNKSLFLNFGFLLWSCEAVLANNIHPATTIDKSHPSIEQIDRYTQQTDLTSVSELSDVQTIGWEFQTLQSLSQRYGCLAGYPDGNYRGNRSLTRYEFAVALNQCLTQINQMIAAGATKVISQEDLSQMQRLQTEFASELTNLRGRIDTLEAQVNQMEANQFSTTTKLEGEIIFALTTVSSGKKADNSDDEIDNNLTLSNRVRLDLETSFTGRDQLGLRLQSRNVMRVSEMTGTDMARLGFEGNTENQFELSQLEYRFRIGKKTRVYIQAFGGSLSDFTTQLNPLLGDIGDSGTGSISRFGQRNPIFRQGGNTGAGITYNFSNAASVSAGYVADNANDTEFGIGGGAYGAIAQATLRPTESFGFALTYIRSFNSLDTGTGSKLSNDPFDGDSEKVMANSYGLEVSWQLSPTVILGSWVGFTQASAKDLSNEPEAQILNYAFTLAFPDLGKEGNIGGIVIGQPPKLISNDLEEDGREYKDLDTGFHLETFYIFQATDNIAITPGILVILNPEHNASNDPIYIVTIRTSFSF